MSQYFPADVSLRVTGDLGDAQKLFPKAANILFKALELQRNGDKRNVSLTAPGTDGSVINVFLSGNLKHVYVQPGPRAVLVARPKEEIVIPEPVVRYFLDMYSGVVCPAAGTGPAVIVSITDPDPPHDPVSALDSFFPESSSAAANNLDLAWQQPKKLGVSSSGMVDGSTAGDDANSALPKPSMYSGAMTRLVAAILGCGRESPTYTASQITGIVPDNAPDEVASNQYRYGYERTTGVYKDQVTGGVWLIEISKDDGVLAMRLPIFDGTDDGEFFQYIAGIGDGDTISVVVEFGGLPTGEPFPTGSDLTDAIAAGSVLRLMDSATILDAYHDSSYVIDKAALFADCGWAFSDTGAKADNVVFWYEDISVVQSDPNSWLLDGHDGDPATHRFMRAQHWSIHIDIDSANNTGSATLTNVEDTVIQANFSFQYSSSSVPDDQWNTTMLQAPTNTVDSALHQVDQFGRYSISQLLSDQGIGEAPVYVFYIGETVQVVRRRPLFQLGNVYGQAAFYGPQLDLGGPFHDAMTGEYLLGGLVIPSFTREAYVLVLCAIPGSGLYSAFVSQSGYFKNLGQVDFTTINTVGDGFYFTNWFNVWTQYKTTRHQYYFGAAVNTGPTPAYVMHDGIGLTATSVLYSGAMADYSLPGGTQPGSVTFIGSV